MAHYFQAHKQSGVIIAPWPLIKRKVKDTLAKSKRCVIAVFTEDEALSYRQIRWWKGVMIPALAKDTGYTESYWETRLKLAVMPEKFQPIPFEYNGETYYRLPSITILSTKEMSQLMEGSVIHLREDDVPEDDKQYKGIFYWVTMPDPELRKD